MQTIKSICVFCASSPGIDPQYMQSARSVGQLLAQEGIQVVYGGASVGLMGALADSTLQHGGEVIGIIPQKLVDYEVAHKDLTKLHIVPDMHARKALMAELSNAFMVLPGGYGTLEETFEVATWAQLGIHNKPFGILNVNHFYTPLLQFLDHAADQQLLATKNRVLMLDDSDPKRLLERLRHAHALTQTRQNTRIV